ncbi:hypothetical protein IC582_002186 [Cucumis melo]
MRSIKYIYASVTHTCITFMHNSLITFMPQISMSYPCCMIFDKMLYSCYVIWNRMFLTCYVMRCSLLAV